jgi:hypothetical protein
MWVNTVHKRTPPKQIILDMDSFVSPTYGDQEGSVYNGYFECTCYHPLFCFNQYGDIERTLRRKLVKIGAKVVRHSRYIIFKMAEVAVPGTLFREIFDRIRQPRFSPIPARPG